MTIPVYYDIPILLIIGAICYFMFSIYHTLNNFNSEDLKKINR